VKALGQEEMPLFRLDPSFIISFGNYVHELEKFKQLTAEVWPLKKLAHVVPMARFASRRLRLEKRGQKAFVLSARSIKPLAVVPIDAGISYVPSKKYLLDPSTILFTETGSKIENVAILPKYLKDLIKTTYEKELPIAATHHLIRGVVNSDIPPCYLAAFFNTKFGKLLIKISTYGSVKPEINPEILKQTKILRFKDQEERISETIETAHSKYESEAWKAYLTNTALVERCLHLSNESAFFSANVNLHEFKDVRRLDPKYLIVTKAIKRFAKKIGGGAVNVEDWFDVWKGTAPMRRDYRYKQGDPYVTSQSISKTGLLDDADFYHLPKDEQSGKEHRATKESLLLTSDAHDIRGIGKVGIVYPYDDLLVMSGLAVLKPKSGANSFYAFAMLKSTLLGSAIRASAYGLTAHLTKESIEKLPIPVLDWTRDDITKMVKTFLDNLYQARKFKRQAISDLESLFNTDAQGLPSNALRISEVSKHPRN
jgi:hypothetical protein